MCVKLAVQQYRSTAICIGVGRFRILGRPMFRILGGGGGGGVGGGGGKGAEFPDGT